MAGTSECSSLHREADRRAFIWRKAHSISGVAPLGVFFCLHLWTNAAALGGPIVYARAVREIEQLPGLGGLEVVLVFLPLSFHAVYGLLLALKTRWPKLRRYPYPAHWLYFAQRLTGVVLVGFIVWHLSEYRLPKLLGHIDAQSLYPTLTARLSSTSFGIPWVALGYMLGVTASVAHLTNGLWGACTSWGVVISAPGRRRAARLFAVLALVLLGLGVATVFQLATGAHLLGHAQ